MIKCNHLKFTEFHDDNKIEMVCDNCREVLN